MARTTINTTHRMVGRRILRLGRDRILLPVRLLTLSLRVVVDLY